MQVQSESVMPMYKKNNPERKKGQKKRLDPPLWRSSAVFYNSAEFCQTYPRENVRQNIVLTFNFFVGFAGFAFTRSNPLCCTKGLVALFLAS